MPEGGRSPADGSVVHRLAGPGRCWTLSHHPLKLPPICFFVKRSVFFLSRFLSLFNAYFVGRVCCRKTSVTVCVFNLHQ